MKAKFLELHLLQNLPPSCVNRDGNNSPKDCDFGTTRRARISSQCLKRAIRNSDSFAEVIQSDIGIRSKQWFEYCSKFFERQGKEEPDEVAREFLGKFAGFDKKDKDKSDVLLYFSHAEIDSLMAKFLEGQKIEKETPAHLSPDVALFGRMLAQAPNMNVDAACQVAHAFSTQKLNQQTDYWTAVDDLKQSDEDAGAGMIGIAEFNSSCFYRYACVSISILQRNLGDDESLTRSAAKAFVLGSIGAYPTGKQSGFAHFSPPDLALATVRTSGAPINLANAFCAAVPGTGPGLVENSCVRIADYYQQTATVAGSPAHALYCTTLQSTLDALPSDSRIASYEELANRVSELI